MVELNSNQLEDAREIAKRPEIVRCRRILVMYKKDDPSYALFRVKAGNETTEILTRTIARKRLLKKTREWLDGWLTDPDDSEIGNTIRDFCAGLERESGLSIILQPNHYSPGQMAGYLVKLE